MIQLLWLICTWIAGTAAILGSLMTVGSLILLVTPAQSRSHKPPQAHPISSSWLNRLKLLAVSLTIALVGLGILIVAPFPTA